MPWKETCAMEERMKFVLEVRGGAYAKAALCRMYGISRPTGDKWLARYEAEGLGGLADDSRAPHTHPNQVPEEIERRVLAVRARFGTWGPKKIRAYLEREEPAAWWPSRSAIAAILTRHGLAVPRKRRRRTPPFTDPFADCDGSNALWCLDFKGWFLTGDGVRCDPFTMTDAFSRYLLRCRAAAGRTEVGQPLMEAAFREYGLPWAIRSDNGSPFASRGIGGLTRLSVWWIKLGIRVERIAPGHPEENGRHERMHRTLKAETARPPASTGRGQQERFDRFRTDYNEVRPHEALGLRTPASVYRPSPRPYPERLGPAAYPDGFVVRRVQKNGEFYWKHEPVFLGEALGYERIGLEPQDERHFTLWFCRLPLAVFDAYEGRVLSWRQAARRGLAKPTGPDSTHGTDEGETDDEVA
jgi:putative transposase